MKNAGHIFIFYCISIVFSGCGWNVKRGNGTIEMHEIELDKFNKVSIGGNYEVTLIGNADPKVTIETDENLFPFINAELYNEILSINNVHRLKSTEGIRVKIYYAGLDKIYSTGASKVQHEGILITENLEINLSGAGAVDLEIQTTNVKVNLTGAGIIKLSGNTDYQETHISGAGGLSAFDLESNKCSINLSGLGGAEVTANEKLEATITGVGGIVYSGNPKIIERQITGFGKIKRAEDFVEEDNI